MPPSAEGLWFAFAAPLHEDNNLIFLILLCKREVHEVLSLGMLQSLLPCKASGPSALQNKNRGYVGIFPSPQNTFPLWPPSHFKCCFSVLF